MLVLAVEVSERGDFVEELSVPGVVLITINSGRYFGEATCIIFYSVLWSEFLSVVIIACEIAVLCVFFYYLFHIQIIMLSYSFSYPFGSLLTLPSQIYFI